MVLLVVSSCASSVLMQERQDRSSRGGTRAPMSSSGSPVGPDAEIGEGDGDEAAEGDDEAAGDDGEQTDAPSDPWQRARAAAEAQLAELAAGDPQRTSPEVAGTPLGLGAQLETAERTLRDDDAGHAMWAAAGHLQHATVRKLIRTPEWELKVRAAMSESLVGFLDLHLEAGRALADMHPTPDYTPGEWPDPPPWRIVPPAPMEELRAYYEKSAARVGIHWSYLAAINLIETKMGRIDGVSVAGAMGPMQFMPGTWDWVGAGDVHDDHDAIMAAGRLLAENGAPGDMDRALLGYNNDVRYVRAVKRYADAMQIEPRQLRGYYYWQVYIPGPEGSRLLPIGFDGR
jgi:soluble lytic murein transglycosylase-like protein